MKGTVHPRRLLLCLVLVPALLAGLGVWQSWRAEQQAERLGAAGGVLRKQSLESLRD
ncbi:hypothetical protein DZ887_025805, partial [Pseudomonas aeruginosa]|nr:hypothetical protein [Pseudomonas aeruginosa]